jgi:hypothetical protein
MTVSTISCDRCGVEISADRTLLTVETGPLRSKRPTVDFCRDCAVAFFSWIDAGVPKPRRRAGAAPNDPTPAAPRRPAPDADEAPP